MISKEEILEFVEAKIEKTDVYIVEVNILLNNKIEVVVDSFDGISIDYCVQLSRDISTAFEDRIGEYELEVSSASMSQAFKVIQQYKKYQGKEVEVLSKQGVKIKGILTKVNPDSFTLTFTKKEKNPHGKKPLMVEKEVEFTYDEIKYTKYIIRF